MNDLLKVRFKHNVVNQLNVKAFKTPLSLWFRPLPFRIRNPAQISSQFKSTAKQFLRFPGRRRMLPFWADRCWGGIKPPALPQPAAVKVSVRDLTRLGRELTFNKAVLTSPSQFIGPVNYLSSSSLKSWCRLQSEQYRPQH